MWDWKSSTVCAVTLVGLLGCSESRVAQVVLPGLNQACGAEGACREPLRCDTSNVCVPPGDVEEGGECVFTDDCTDGLYCRDVCTRAGDAALGEACGSTADCEPGLWCEPQGIGAACAASGAGDIDATCTTTSDCAAGLLCNPFLLRCTDSLPPPIGDTCENDTQCAPDVGVFCDRDTNTCLGSGPDGLPIPGDGGTPLVPWDGVSCEANDNAGPFRVYFDVPPTGNDEFFRLPFPNDIRMSGGTVDLTGFPTPPLTSVPADLLGNYIDAIEATQDGFGPNQSVFLRFSKAPLFCERGCGEGSNPACAPGCMGGTEETVFLFDITAGELPALPVRWGWVASTGRTQYLCQNWVSLAPTAEGSWREDHTYVVFIRSTVLSSEGDAMNQDTDFAAMLAGTAPGDSGPLDAAYTAYAPLRDWLGTNPTFPGGGMITAADLAGGAVFTVRDPKRTMSALGDVIYAGTAPAVRDLVVCDSAAAGTDCTDTTGFTVVHGVADLPSFQEGTVPFETAGGGIVTDGAGVPQVQGTQEVRFALSVPDGTPPVGGWPVVLYSHGTGGDYRSHVSEGLAEALASVNVSVDASTAQFAVLGIDQVAHGTRKGSSTTDSDILFFNFLNPPAARGNILQGAADQLSLQMALTNLSTELDSNTSFGTLDTGTVMFLGHSQGATVGTPAMTRAEGITVVTLSGAGGGLIDTLGLKTSPFNLPAIMAVAFADPFITNPRNHPALSIVQGYMEDADATNYVRFLSADPIAPAPAKNVLHILGVGDTYTPNRTSMSFARRMLIDFMDTTPASGLLVTTDFEISPGPVQGNRTVTRVTSIHTPAATEDGHFVLFNVPKAEQRMVEFFGSALTDVGGIPTVVD